MRTVYRCCCGIDVHKKLIVACLKKGGGQEVREFGTMTGEIRDLGKWLKESGCEMAAMESTGVYWKPLYNLFELMELDVMVVNAAHMKAVPGRKTDVKDAEWIAELLQHGLLKASFIPSREQRELRELTRYRKSLTEECSRELSRLQKVLEGANVKLASVVGDIQGKSARKLLDKLAAGDSLDREDVLPLLHKTMQSKLDNITSSLESITTPLQRALLRQILDHIDNLNRRVAVLDGMVEQYMAEYAQALEALDAIPGIAKRSAQVILAEIGWIWTVFPAPPICVPGLGFLRATIKVRENGSMEGQTRAIKPLSPCWPNARKRLQK